MLPAESAVGGSELHRAVLFGDFSSLVLAEIARRPNSGRACSFSLHWKYNKREKDPSMSQPTRTATPLYTQVDITSNATAAPAPVSGTPLEQNRLLHDILMALDRQNEMMEELINQVSAAQKQRIAELAQWKDANPKLAKSCKAASEALAKVQTEFLATLTTEINDNPEVLMDGEFMLNEFIDRYGPRLAHLNGVLQVLAQLGSVPHAAAAPN